MPVDFIMGDASSKRLATAAGGGTGHGPRAAALVSVPAAGPATRLPVAPSLAGPLDPLGFHWELPQKGTSFVQRAQGLAGAGPGSALRLDGGLRSHYIGHVRV